METPLSKKKNNYYPSLFFISIGGLLEVYDFVVYIYLSSWIQPLFFPQANQYQKFLITFGPYALGSMVRPLGGILFAHFGDVYSRRRTLLATTLCMGIPTLLTGLLPTFQSVSYLAPILLLSLRVLQGLSFGAEASGSFVMAYENAPAGQQCLHGAVLSSLLTSGALAATALIFILKMILPTSAMALYGWRIPFILGGFIGLANYYWRQHTLQESMQFLLCKQEQQQRYIPLFTLIKEQWSTLWLATTLALFNSAAGFTLIGYLPHYLVHFSHIKETTAMMTSSIALFSIIIIQVGVAILADRTKKQHLLIYALISIGILFSVLFYGLLHAGSAWRWLCLATIILLACLVSGIYPTILCELFPTRFRYTAIAVAHNIGHAVSSGMIAFIYLWLINTTKNPAAPGWYLSALALLTLSLFLRHQKSSNKWAYSSTHLASKEALLE